MKYNFRYLQLLFVLILLIGAAFVCFAPTDYIGNNPQQLYWINLYSIISGLGGMFVTLRMFAFHTVRQQVRNEQEALGYKAYEKWTKIRLMLLAFALWSNVLLFQASSYTTTPKYCMLIILVAFVFCWPSKTEFTALRNQ